nr:hypothetical protein [Tanacetum cinerariifolium]
MLQLQLLLKYRTEHGALIVRTSQQQHLFSLAGVTFFTSSGNFFWQWEVFTGSGNALCILFPTKSSTANVETSINDEVFHEISESFQGESSSSSLNDDVQQCPEEVILPQTNTQSIPINMVSNGDEANFLSTLPKWNKDHPLHKIIGDSKSSVRTRGQLANSCD